MRKPPAERVRLADHKVEMITSLKDLRRLVLLAYRLLASLPDD